MRHKIFIDKLRVEERYALGDQIRRVVVPMPFNIVAGNGRAANKDYADFVSIARGSLCEAMTQHELAEDLGCVTLMPEIEQLAKDVWQMLGATIKKFSALHFKP